jgi:uncharacterized membrane protein YtjA (UPF0391 family)
LARIQRVVDGFERRQRRAVTRDLFRLCREFKADLKWPSLGTQPLTCGLSDQAGWYRSQHEDLAMLGWVLTFLVVALIAGVLGFGGIAGASIEIAKVIFFIAVVLFLISVIFGAFRGRSSP